MKFWYIRYLWPNCAIYPPYSGILCNDYDLDCFKTSVGPTRIRFVKIYKIFKVNSGEFYHYWHKFKVLKFFDMTFDLASGTHRSYYKPNYEAIYISTRPNKKRYCFPIPRYLKLTLLSIFHVVNIISQSQKWFSLLHISSDKIIFYY